MKCGDIALHAFGVKIPVFSAAVTVFETADESFAGVIGFEVAGLAVGHAS